MIVKVDVPLNLTIFPPSLIRQIAGGMDQAQIKALFPNMATRMKEFGHYAAATWKEKIAKIPGATGRPLKLGPPMTQLNRPAYVASVMVAPPEWEPNALSVSIYSESEQAEVVEKGGVEIDLHDVLPYARKARKGRNGLYLRIPFRHATSTQFFPPGGQFRGAAIRQGHGALTSGLLSAMAQKPRYVRTKYLGAVPSETQPGQHVRRFLYSPAKPAQLTMREIQAVNVRARTHKISNEYAKLLVGLMHVGRKGHGHYLTIRTLSQANEKGWRIPAYRPQHVLAHVAREVELEMVAGWFDEALKADVQNWERVQAGASA